MIFTRYLQEQSGSNNASDCPEEEDLGDFSKYLYYLGVTLFVVWVFYTIYLLRTFRRLKLNCVLLRTRFVPFLYLQVFGAGFQWAWAIVIFIPRDKLPCSLIYSLPVSLLMLQVFPFAIRLLLFHNRVLLNQILARSVLLKRTDESPKISETKVTSSLTMYEQQTTSMSDQTMKRSKGSKLSTSTWRKVTRLNLINKLRFLSSAKFGYLLYIIGVALWIGYSVKRGQEFKGCVNCDPSQFDFLEVYIPVVVILALSIPLLVKVRKEPDPMRVKADLLFNGVAIAVGSSFWALSYVDPSDLQKEGSVLWMLCWAIWGFVLVYGLLGFPVWILKEKKRSKRLDEFRQNNNLINILKSKAGRDLLQVQMMNELNVEHFFFYVEAIAWKKMFQVKRPDYIAIRLIQAEITSKFFEKDAPFSINIGSEQRRKVLEASDEIDITIFDECLTEVANLIVTDVLPRFRATRAYQEVFMVEKV